MDPQRGVPAEIVASGNRDDARRAQELYKYFDPSSQQAQLKARQGDVVPTDELPHAPAATVKSSEVAAGQATSPDTALTAYAQLVAWRLDAKRAIISLIDDATQYMVAESTKTLNLGYTHESENPDDRLLVGCSKLSKEGQLCEVTMSIDAVDSGYPCFIVPDLRADPRFAKFPFVAGPPFVRFYAGTPITTNRGIRIGTVFILDDTPRDGLNEEQKNVLGTMADTIMRHLELYRGEQERRRGIIMSRALASFVEGKGRGPMKKSLSQVGLGLRATTPGVKDTLGSDPTKSSPIKTSTGRSRPELVKTLSQRNVMRSKVATNPATVHYETFNRAAGLLRECLELDDQGGVIFYEAPAGLSEFGSTFNPDSNTSSDDDPQLASPIAEKPVEGRLSFDDEDISKTTFGEPSSRKTNDSADILGLSASVSDLTDENTGEEIDSFRPMTHEHIRRFLKRYPRGKLWSFYDPDDVSGSSDEPTSPASSLLPASLQQLKQRKSRESTMLKDHFPGVRQLLFAPLWDPASRRWFSGCFAWSTSRIPVLSSELELQHLVAFGDCIMAEVSRLNAIAADQQKSDFIGSISHEFRSPLHGILASTEFLAESELDTFQRDMVNTVGSCGRTLLDTINHVLDYSKINSFEKSWRNARKRRRGSRKTDKESKNETTLATRAPQLNMYAEIDVAAVCEEVVEGIYAGQVFQHFPGRNYEDAISTQSAHTDKLLEIRDREKHIQVILDIEKTDWRFTTQPGALRRVIMNIFGNAIKYTAKGWVRVKLELREGHRSQRPDNATEGRYNHSVAIITITDTGSGIGEEYLRTRLFTPFAQENSLAPGTGLGLSLVRSIMNMLGGDIGIESQVGVGTEVKIRFPLVREEIVKGTGITPSTGESSGGSSGNSSSSGMIKELESTLKSVQDAAKGKSISVFGLGVSKPTTPNTGVEPVHIQAGQYVRASVARYAKEWFGFDINTSQNPSEADLIVIDEADMPAMIDSDPDSSQKNRPPIVILCSHASRYGKQNFVYAKDGEVQEFVSKPFGPYKLAKGLSLCFQKLSQSSDAQPRRNSTTSIEPVAVVQVESGVDVIEFGFREVTLQGETSESPPIKALDNGVIAIKEDSVNAHRMAADFSSPTGTPGQEDRKDFPFPKVDSTGNILSRSPSREQSFAGSIRNRSHPASPLSNPPSTPGIEPFGAFPRSPGPIPRSPGTQRPPHSRTKSANRLPTTPLGVPLPPSPTSSFKPTTPAPIPETPQAPSVRPSTKASSIRSSSSGPSSPTTGPKSPSSPSNPLPRILLVDDNVINLRLLETFIKKRSYPHVMTASNGALAVQAWKSAVPRGFDIVFMDISMPVMDGFEATRCIRREEQEVRDTFNSGTKLSTISGDGVGDSGIEEPPTPATIIALTGLASARDQSEAFSSGVDLFMTKPASLKEVGRLLENWERNAASGASPAGRVGAGFESSSVHPVQRPSENEEMDEA